MNVVHERDRIAAKYGFATYAELLDISIPLPAMGGDRFKSYLARGMGYWFVWDDHTQPYGDPPEPESLE